MDGERELSTRTILKMLDGGKRSLPTREKGWCENRKGCLQDWVDGLGGSPESEEECFGGEIWPLVERKH